jgi:hypothetical protein
LIPSCLIIGFAGSTSSIEKRLPDFHISAGRRDEQLCCNGQSKSSVITEPWLYSPITSIQERKFVTGDNNSLSSFHVAWKPRC